MSADETRVPRRWALIVASVLAGCGATEPSGPWVNVQGNNTGISVSLEGSEGTDFAIERLFYDGAYDDHAVVYLKDSVALRLGHNANNTDWDGAPTTGGKIRCKFDGDEAYRFRYGASYLETDTLGFAESEGVVWNYGGPFTVAQRSKGVGDNSAEYPHHPATWGASSEYYKHYHYGTLDEYGDEWHTLTYWDSDKTDGKTLLLVVNSTTPAISCEAYGSGQYYTTPAKAYYHPAIRAQTTHLTSQVNIRLHNVTDERAIEYRVGSAGEFVGYTGQLSSHDLFGTDDTVYEFQYRFVGSATVRTRLIHYNPARPSSTETHPVLLYSPDELSTMRSRILREPYASHYDWLRDSVDLGLPTGDGLRHGTVERAWSVHAANAAFVWQMDGAAEYADLAKALLLDRSHDWIGAFTYYMEGFLPEMELAKNWENVNWVIAYDLLVGYAGMTSIEERKIRDNIASMVRTLIGRSWFMNNHNHLFNTYTMVAAAACALPAYDTVLGHARGASRGGQDATCAIDPTPSWMDAIYDQDLNLNATGYPGYSTNGLWGRFSPSGRVLESTRYYPYKFYSLLPQYMLFSDQALGGRLASQHDRFRNSPLRGLFTRRPSDGKLCPSNHVRTSDEATFPFYYWMYINDSFDFEYAPGETIAELAAWNNQYQTARDAPVFYHGDRVLCDPFFIALYDDTITPRPPSKESWVSAAGFSFYSDFQSPESIFVYQHGEDDNSYDYWERPDNIYFTIDAFGERFTASIDEYRLVAGCSMDLVGLYNNVLVDDSGGLNSGLGRFTLTLTDLSFENAYCNYGSVATQTASKDDTSVFAHDIQQYRHVLFPFERYIMVIDQMRARDGLSHTYEWMHNGLGSTSVTQATQTATVTTTSGRRLAMQIASSANADLVLSTSSKAPGVTSELKARAPSSGNLDFLVLLYPLDLSDTAPIVTDVSSAGTAALRIVDDNGDLVVLSSPAAQAASAEWLQATGEIAAAARTGTTAQFFQLVRGRSIDLGGVELFSSTQLVSVSARVLSDRYDYQLVPGSGVTATTVTFGALQAGATYRLYADGVEVGPCTALADGTVSFDQPLTASTYSLRR